MNSSSNKRCLLFSFALSTRDRVVVLLSMRCSVSVIMILKEMLRLLYNLLTKTINLFHSMNILKVLKLGEIVKWGTHSTEAYFPPFPHFIISIASSHFIISSLFITNCHLSFSVFYWLRIMIRSTRIHKKTQYFFIALLEIVWRTSK